MTKPGLDIHKHKKSGQIVITTFACDRRFGYSKAWGDLVQVSADQMQRDGIAIVLENIKGFHDRDDNLGSELQKMPAKEQRKFDKEYLVVGVRQESSTQLILTPMHPEGGGFVGHRDQELLVELPCSPEQFSDTLTRAFEAAG